MDLLYYMNQSSCKTFIFMTINLQAGYREIYLSAPKRKQCKYANRLCVPVLIFIVAVS